MEVQSDKKQVDWVACTVGEEDSKRVMIVNTACPFCHKDSLHQIEVKCYKKESNYAQSSSVDKK